MEAILIGPGDGHEHSLPVPGRTGGDHHADTLAGLGSSTKGNAASSGSRLERLPKLGEDACLRIEAAETEAEERLVGGLTEFFEDCASGRVHLRLRRNPGSEDLWRYFYPFGAAVFNVHARERLDAVSSKGQLRAYSRWLKAPLIDYVAKKIYGRKWPPVVGTGPQAVVRRRLQERLYRHVGNGVWVRAVEESIAAAGFGANRTEYGEYGLADFLRVRTQQLRVRLLRRARIWEAKAKKKLGASSALVNHPRLSTNHPAPIQDKPASAPTAESDSSPTATPETKAEGRALRKEPHPDPASVLANNPAGLTYRRAGELLGVGVRRIQQLVSEGTLEAQGKGNAKRITNASLRHYLDQTDDLAKNSEKPRNPAQ